MEHLQCTTCTKLKKVEILDLSFLHGHLCIDDNEKLCLNHRMPFYLKCSKNNIDRVYKHHIHA